MADVNYHSVAFAGSGSVDPATATTLLNDWLPSNLGAALRPTRIPRKNATLNAIVNWLETEPDDDNDTLGPNGTKGSDNLVSELLSLRDGGDEVTMVYLLPEYDDENPLPEAEEELLRNAFAAGITVKNLAGAGALDDLDPDEIFPVKAAPEQEQKTEMLGKAAAYAEAVESAGLDTSLVGSGGRVLLEALEYFVVKIIDRELAARQPDARQVESEQDMRSTMEKVAAKLNDVPFDGPYKTQEVADNEPRTKYYVSEDGRYRIGKTRPRKGETVAMLTASEVDSLTENELID